MTPDRRGMVLTALALVAAAFAIWWQFSNDLAAARTKVALGSTLIVTPGGLIEYQETGSGLPLLAVHGGDRGDPTGKS